MCHVLVLFLSILKTIVYIQYIIVEICWIHKKLVKIQLSKLDLIKGEQVGELMEER